MSQPLAFALVTLVLTCSVATQAPLHPDLVNAKSAYIASDGVDRRWLDRLVRDFRKEKRFTLVNSRGDADVVITISKERGAMAVVPVGPSVVGAETQIFRLVVTRPMTNEALWDDARDVAWTYGGAIGGLVKRLHDDLRREQRARQ